MEEQVKLYFAAGCFWHVQHSFIKGEESILQRSGFNLTSLAGYAGSTKPGTACYYDGKVTTEVVGMEIPRSSVSKFAEIYFKLFIGHDRSHSNDKGPHYRAAVGLPGGAGSSLLGEITKSQVQGQSFEFKEGQGDDADTLHTRTIWVYDSDRFPFHQAEIYHQFHDDYCCNGDYPASYEALRTLLTCDGKLKPTGCTRDTSALLSQLDCAKPSDKPNQLDSLSNVVPSGGSGDISNTPAKMNPAADNAAPTEGPTVTGSAGDTMLAGSSTTPSSHQHDASLASTSSAGLLCAPTLLSSMLAGWILY